MGNAIVTKDRRWLWGLQYFCYGTLNSYEFSNATTVNNGESARNNGGRTRRDGREKHIFFLALLIFLRRRPPWNSEVLVNRSIDRFLYLIQLRSEKTSLQEKGNRIAPSLIGQCFKENCFWFLLVLLLYYSIYSILNSRNFDF